MARRIVGELVEDKALFSKFEVLEDIQEKSEALPKGVIMRVRGMFAQADRVTQNGTLYKKSLWEREVERIKPNLEERSVLMLSDHPEKLPDGSVKSPVGQECGRRANQPYCPARREGHGRGGVRRH
jgi:hypothetical protein